MPLARAAMHARGETLHVAQWPWVKEMHQVASRHYAFEGTCFVIAAGAIVSHAQLLEDFAAAGGSGEASELLAQMQPGDDGMLLRGGSAVIAPDGRYIVEPLYGKSETVYADVDTGEVTEARLALDTDGHYSRPDVFHLDVDTRARRNVSFNG